MSDTTPLVPKTSASRKTRLIRLGILGAVAATGAACCCCFFQQQQEQERQPGGGGHGHGRAGHTRTWVPILYGGSRGVGQGTGAAPSRTGTGTSSSTSRGGFGSTGSHGGIGA